MMVVEKQARGRLTPRFSSRVHLGCATRRRRMKHSTCQPAHLGAICLHPNLRHSFRSMVCLQEVSCGGRGQVATSSLEQGREPAAGGSCSRAADKAEATGACALFLLPDPYIRSSILITETSLPCSGGMGCRESLSDHADVNCGCMRSPLLGSQVSAPSIDDNDCALLRSLLFKEAIYLVSKSLDRVCTASN